ncbi:MAG: CRTAC1 family protein [Acidobacteriaceae bacterium]|nr:CRTAC1 family protein [Acidobacteriaceae bacterium]
MLSSPLRMGAAILSLCALALASAELTEKLHFTDIAEPSGIRAVMRCGGPEKRWIPEANGSGTAWLDYDNDGLPDLLIVNGGNMEQLRKIVGGDKVLPVEGGVYLYHNEGNGHFVDVTEKAGLANPYWGTGANAADYNNDGFTDILITTIGLDLLYKNNGNGTFTEVSKVAGLRQKAEWHTGSAFGDFDGDGHLDLFVASYLDLHDLSFKEPAPVCEYFGQHVFCGPLGLKGGRNVLYHNNGNGTFSDITEHSGIAEAPPAHGFTAVAGDFNGDGKLDLFVANDSDPNFLFLNQSNGTFKETALDRGVAYNADGRTQSNMGVAIGEYGRSGHLDVLTTVFNKDYFPLFRQGPSGVYEESAASVGLATATMKYLGWACGLTDFDNSGKRDFWTANGHVYPTDKDYNEPITIFRSLGNRTELVYQYPVKPNNSYRGGAAADFNNDGKVDLLVLPIAGLPVLLRNDTLDKNNWLGLQLRGTRSNRDAIGATVTVESCGQKQSDAVRSGGSYLSRNDWRLHFGVGPCRQVDRVTIQWPTGKMQTINSLPLNRYVTIEEPK